MIREQDGVALARFARAAITAALGGPPPDAPAFPGAEEPGATFVTLHRGDTLHGCIGTIEPRRPLVDDVRSNAVSAALFDPRATPLSPDDVDALSVEVSLLGPLERIPCRTEADAIAALTPGEGVVFRSGLRRATYLPQVWENLPDPKDFLRSLKTKAGLPATYWSEDVELYRYSVKKFAA
jgi:AmmeMemoRadiSam system protein A